MCAGVAEFQTYLMHYDSRNTSATETVDFGSILVRVKPKTLKIGIHTFPALR